MRSEKEEVKEVFFMRHGKTSENMANILIGQNDPPLSDEAREEIKSLRHFVVQPDIVFSSDLKRASETAQILFPDREVILLPELRERNCGEFQGKPVSVLREASLNRMVLSELDCDEDAFANAGVEPLSSLKARAEKALKLIKRADAQRVMVVSHGGFISCLINNLFSEAQINRPLNNLHYHKVTLDSEGKIVDVRLYQTWQTE
jgi:alpha-ribazole phosphatase